VNYFFYLHGHCTHAPSHSSHPVLGGELIFLQVFINRPVWIYFGLLVELWVGVSNFICRWMHILYYFIIFVWLYTLIHIIYTYTHFIHLYTLCRVWNFWLIFRQNKFLYIGYGFCYIFWIESNPYLYEHNIHDVMQVLQFQKKGLHLNTVEHFYIHKEAASNSHLIDEHTISPSWVFDTILNILSKQ